MTCKDSNTALHSQPQMLSSHCKKINSKWTVELEMSGKTIKLVKESMGVNCNDLGLGNRKLWASLIVQLVKNPAAMQETHPV